MDPAERTRARVRVEGIVQGVGFRPFVHGVAAQLALGGFVRNDGRGVLVEVEGDRRAVAAFVATLGARPPALAVVERVAVESIPPVGERGFRILGSVAAGAAQTLVSADTATCRDCLAELFDPTDRRYRYPFINCTNCGPRFTIVTGIPYDRAATTMAAFPMCDRCRAEYDDPADRRFHAQPVCCPRCGPTLRLVDAAARPLPGDPVTTAAALLAAGQVLAVKGLGGYHLAVDAADETAVATLRRRKHREDKPFAVMCPDLPTVRALCRCDDAAATVLESRRRPIVLLPRSDPPGAVAASVAPGYRDLGVLLPYTPLHHLLAGELGRPFVLTSGNVSDEPIAYVDDDAVRRLAGVADAFLTSDRDIHVRTDDSVVRVVRGRELPLRRSRGYVPEPLTVPWVFPREVLACGAELKNTFCLGKGSRAFLSHHVGDLENLETWQAFTAGIEHFCGLFDVHPEVVAYDLHPEYLSTKYALDRAGVELVGVQHHHAHVAACLADNGHPGPVVGLALDGLGYGTDGTLWGGEVLVADLAGFQRAGHLTPVPMPGGVAAVREPWRMAATYLHALGHDGAGLAVAARHPDRWGQVWALCGQPWAAPLTSSAGRLFDAVAALVGVRDLVTYEGQAAVGLEHLVDPAETGSYPMRVSGGEPLLLHGTDLFAAVLDDVCAGVSPGRVAARFHNGLAAGLVTAVLRVQERTGLSTAALSGGVFQNVVLLDRVVTGLTAQGVHVLTHSRVPPNDGGVSLGQAAVAAARNRTVG